MKRTILLLSLFTLVLSLCACGAAQAETTPTVPAQPADPGYTFTHKDVRIAMSAPAADLIAALGEPVSFTEQASCAFTGLDKTYYYGSFYMDTYPAEDGDRVYSLWIVDDTVTTEEGLYIGAAQAQVEAIYGADGFNGANAYILEKGVCRLTILLEEGVVTSIQYDAILN